MLTICSVVAATYLRMRAAGVPIVGGPRIEAYGRVAVFLDLEGNRWDLLGELALAGEQWSDLTGPDRDQVDAVSMEITGSVRPAAPPCSQTFACVVTMA